MTILPFPKILTTTALCLAVLGLNSCIVSTNLGGVVGNIGVKESRNSRGMPFTAEEVSSVIHPVSVQLGSTMPPPSRITAHDLRIYKLGNLYYMELYCQYVPQESGLFLLWTPHSGDMEQAPLFETSEEELLRTPVEAQMVLMNAEKVQHCLQIQVDNPPDDAEQIIPKEQFDFTRAVRCTPNPETSGGPGSERFWFNEYYMPQLPKKKNFLHYTLQPLAWSLKIVDHIPHVLVMAPAAIIAAPLWLAEQVQQQNEMHSDKED